jgi:hypothetical protein
MEPLVLALTIGNVWSKPRPWKYLVLKKTTLLQVTRTGLVSRKLIAKIRQRKEVSENLPKCTYFYVWETQPRAASSTRSIWKTFCHWGWSEVRKFNEHAKRNSRLQQMDKGNKIFRRRTNWIRTESDYEFMRSGASVFLLIRHDFASTNGSSYWLCDSWNQCPTSEPVGPNKKIRKLQENKGKKQEETEEENCVFGWAKGRVGDPHRDQS